MFFVHTLPFLYAAFDLATLIFIFVLLFISLLSLGLIFHLCFKSRTALHLRHFNSLWTVRFLLVFFVILWSLNELLRSPFLRRTYLYPFLGSSLNRFNLEESHFCKLQVALSLGFLEPAFLLTLLFLLDVSIKKNTPNVSLAITFVLFTCLPMLCLHVFFLFFSPFQKQQALLPDMFFGSSVVKKNEWGHTVALCAYPLWNTIIFGAFAIGYSFWFLHSCWRVLSLVINKGLRMRIYWLAVTVLVPLPVQILLLGLSVWWKPDHQAFPAVSFAVFWATFSCAVVGEGILVIKPTADSLAAGGECCRWDPKRKLNSEEEDGSLV